MSHEEAANRAAICSVSLWSARGSIDALATPLDNLPAVFYTVRASDVRINLGLAKSCLPGLDDPEIVGQVQQLENLASNASPDPGRIAEAANRLRSRVRVALLSSIERTPVA